MPQIKLSLYTGSRHVARYCWRKPGEELLGGEETTWVGEAGLIQEGDCICSYMGVTTATSDVDHIEECVLSWEGEFISNIGDNDELLGDDDPMDDSML